MSRPEQQSEINPKPEILSDEQPGDRPIDPLLRYLGLPPEDADVFLDFAAKQIEKDGGWDNIDATTRLSDPEGVAFTYHKNPHGRTVNEQPPQAPETDSQH